MGHGTWPQDRGHGKQLCHKRKKACELPGSLGAVRVKEESGPGRQGLPENEGSFNRSFTAGVAWGAVFAGAPVAKCHKMRVFNHKIYCLSALKPGSLRSRRHQGPCEGREGDWSRPFLSLLGLAGNVRCSLARGGVTSNWAFIFACCVCARTHAHTHACVHLQTSPFHKNAGRIGPFYWIRRPPYSVKASLICKSLLPIRPQAKSPRTKIATYQFSGDTIRGAEGEISGRTRFSSAVGAEPTR